MTDYIEQAMREIATEIDKAAQSLMTGDLDTNETVKAAVQIASLGRTLAAMAKQQRKDQARTPTT